MSDKGPIEQIKELARQASLEVDFAVASHNAAVFRQKIVELEAKLTECEARLEKAVDALESVISCSNDVRLVHDAEATLTEIKGEKDE